MCICHGLHALVRQNNVMALNQRQINVVRSVHNLQRTLLYYFMCVRVRLMSLSIYIGPSSREMEKEKRYDRRGKIKLERQ